METISQEDAEKLVSRHLEIFCEPDRARRERAMPAVYTADLLFADPHHQGVGQEAYGDAADALHASLPGFSLSATGPLDVHHDLARFEWALSGRQGIAATGIDVIRFRSGQIAEVSIFIDPPARR